MGVSPPDAGGVSQKKAMRLGGSGMSAISAAKGAGLGTGCTQTLRQESGDLRAVVKRNLLGGWALVRCVHRLGDLMPGESYGPHMHLGRNAD